MAALRVFISHATNDSAFAGHLATDLRDVGADVWLDSSHLTEPGDFVAKISRALNERDVLVLALSPAAIASQWVPAEMNAAIVRANQGFMRPPLVVQCIDVPLRDIPGLWTTYQRVEMMRDYGSALPRVLVALGLNQPASPPPIGTPSLVKSEISIEAAPLPDIPLPTQRKLLFLGHLLRIGIVFGLILAVIAFLLLEYTYTLGISNWLVSGFVFLGFVPMDTIIYGITFLFACFAGFRTSTQSGRIYDGLLAGMLVGFIGILLERIGDNILGLFIGPDIEVINIKHGEILLVLQFTVVGAMIGLCAGALGGLVGRWRAKS